MKKNSFEPGIIAALMTIFDVLIAELEKNGSLDKAQLIETLRQRASKSRAIERPDNMSAQWANRIVEAFANHLADPKGKPLWSPTVIPGGKDDDTKE